jgi:hypothetical protein
LNVFNYMDFNDLGSMRSSRVLYPFAPFAKGIRARLALGFPQPSVTSDLDPKIQRADDRRGGGDARRNRERGSNSFVLKILTSKPLPLKILQTIFANPAPVAAFRGWGGGGYPLNPAVLPKRTRRKKLFSTYRRNFFRNARIGLRLNQGHHSIELSKKLKGLQTFHICGKSFKRASMEL